VVYGDSAYGTGANLTWLDDHGFAPMVKAGRSPLPAASRGSRSRSKPSSSSSAAWSSVSSAGPSSPASGPTRRSDNLGGKELRVGGDQPASEARSSDAVRGMKLSEGEWGLPGRPPTGAAETV
jgi:hypothetical protein